MLRSIAGVLALACGATPAQAGSPVDARPALLQALDGRWVMTGDVLGKPVTYELRAGPTLSGAFSELHMTDVQAPPEYEARVFLGWDAESQVVFVHWLDSFGGKYSVPHGTGRIDGDTLVFTLPYADGTFRDTLVRESASGRWRLKIEAGQPDGSWKHFAEYEIRRETR